jgi:hypothetical protein
VCVWSMLFINEMNLNGMSCAENNGQKLSEKKVGTVFFVR